jgi:transcriptional regulator with XRE-family HTH domain
MSFNYAKLRGRIVEKYGSQREFAEKIGMTNETLSRKMTGKTYFRQDEIYKIANLLGIGTEQLDDYFFCKLS